MNYLGHTMDTLSEFLANVHVEASSIGTFALNQPWGITMAGQPFLFVVTQGECILKQKNGLPVSLTIGDSVLALHGDLVSIASDVTANPVGIAEVWRANNLPQIVGDGQPRPMSIKWGGEGRFTQLIGLVATLPKNGPGAALVRALPPIIIQSNDQTRLLPWINQMTAFLSHEQLMSQAGYMATAAVLAQFVLISLLRSFSLSAEARSIPWFKNRTATGIGRALELMRTRPDHAWTVAELATEAGMSRTVFTQRFATVTSCTPIDYLKSCRMRLAAQHVIAAKTPIAELASELGYHSERAFRHMFKREHGLSPAAYRKKAHFIDASPANKEHNF